VSAALQVYYPPFDADFFQLPPNVRARIEAKIDLMGSLWEQFPHHQLKGSKRYRLRVGDYRVIYALDRRQGILHLLAAGHRREIYRQA
jgi:mRNA interferase RelE/StbE